jgi:DNA-binding transcriptional LysR family regulator
MQNENVRWEDLRVLLAVSRATSFLAAGRALGVSTSTVARRVSVLEEHLGVRLVRRGASGTTVEPGAAALVELAERIEKELAATARDVRAEPENLAGVVRISLGEGFVRFVSGVAAAFRREYPETLFELVAEQRVVDLPKREADIAIRTVKSASHAIVSRKLGELRYGLFAAEEYLRRSGHARLSWESFPEHDFVIFEGFLERQPEIRWLRERGATRFPFRASTTEGVLEGCIAAQGIAALPTIMADPLPLLRRIPLSEEPPSKPVFLAMHRDMRRVPRVRAFVDVLENAARRVLGEYARQADRPG